MKWLEESSIPLMRNDESFAQIRRSVGGNIKRLRVAQGMTQGTLAGMVGINRPYLSRIESGSENASIDMLIKITEGLETPLPALFEGVDQRFSEPNK